MQKFKQDFASDNSGVPHQAYFAGLVTVRVARVSSDSVPLSKYIRSEAQVGERGRLLYRCRTRRARYPRCEGRGITAKRKRYVAVGIICI